MERRKAIRAPLRALVRYTTQASTQTETSMLSRDISAGGLGVVVMDRLPQDALMTLDVQLPGDQAGVKARAKVAWQDELRNHATSSHPPQFASGLEFTEISAEAKAKVDSLVLETLKERSEDATATISSLLERKLADTQKQFVFQKRVFLKDTNAEGNVYFAHFFEWQGEAREEFFRQNVPDHMQILQSGIRLITVNSWMTFKHSAYLFDDIVVDIKTAHLKQLSLELVFTFIRKQTSEVIAYGGQKLAFADPNGAMIPIPPSIRENAKYFLIESAPGGVEVYERMRHNHN